MKKAAKIILSIVVVTFSVTMYAVPVFAGPISDNLEAVEMSAPLPPCPSLFRCRAP